MEMKKRVISVLLMAVMCVSLLAGCGGGSGSSSGGSKKPVKKAAYTLEETVIADNEYYAASVISASTNDDNDCVIEFSFTNKTEEELYMTTSQEYVNGYVAYFMWSEENEHAYTMSDAEIVNGLLAAPGETVTGEGYIPWISIENTGKAAVEEFEARVLVDLADQESLWSGSGKMAELYNNLSKVNSSSEGFAVYPTGLSEDTIEYAEPEEVEGEQVLEDNEYFTYIIQSFEKSKTEEDRYILDTYVKNKMDEAIAVSWENVRINGKDADLNQYTYLYGGKRTQDVNYITGEYIEGYPVGEDIEEIAFTLRVYENADTSTAPIYEADFTYTVP